MAKPILLIDGDQFLFKACAALEVEVQWDDQNHVLACNAVEAWDVFLGSLEKVKDELGSDTSYLAFSGEGNFRKDLCGSYKAKRGRKPLCYSTLYEKARTTLKSFSVDGLEADDLMGIWSTSGKFSNAIIVSDDKDMQTLPGLLYRKFEDDYEVRELSVGEADRFWLYQTLTGDTADGYPGCPGVGKVKAERLLNEFMSGKDFMLKEAWEAVVKTFEAAGLGFDDALLQARLARILRASDWDSERKEVKLWNPS